jgi:DNA polymerase elongation subunit (family B)
MDRVNEDYWYNQWHLDFEVHDKVGIKNVTQIDKSEHVSIYADTDSLFVSFKPAIDHCDWENLVLSDIDNIDKKFIVLSKAKVRHNNPNCIGVVHSLDELKDTICNAYDLLVFDGHFIKDRNLNKLIKDGVFTSEIKWNWTSELDLIQGLDHFKYGGYFKQCLEDYAASFGVENKEDFELEKISESIINIAKKKYIQHIVHEDGINFDPMTYIFPKGVELVRSSTPLFARDKIVDIVRYLFSNPDTFNIKELLKLVKNLRKEFELADIDDIAMQSSCSNYDAKIIDDKTLPLRYVNGAHFAVKAAAYHNYLLNLDRAAQQKYEFIKSGTKIKYYVCKDKTVNDQFAYMRGSYPHEFAPEIDYDIQFSKAILSPINSIIEPLGLPEITSRLTIVMDIFGGF